MNLKKIVNPFLFLLFLLISFSCISPSEPTIPWAPGGYYPIVTGIYVTSETGRILGAIGKPNGKGGDNGLGPYYSNPILGLPFPNPNNGTFRISFNLYSYKGRVIIWAVRARTESNSERLVMFNTSAILKTGGEPYRIFIDKELSSSNNIVVVEFKNSDGEIDTGIYRIYLKIEHDIYPEKLFWQDVMVVDEKTNIFKF